MAKRCRASVAGAFHPLTDGSFADPEGLGDLALGPALLFEMSGLEPSGFSPVIGCRVHAWEYSTDPSRAVDFYTRVSNTLAFLHFQCDTARNVVRLGRTSLYSLRPPPNG
jgi:hypothetical protein